MPQYDLEKDNPYGIASADFPITLYDRPSLMMGNILRGDVDGLTRAMLSPSTLSPAQMKTTRDFLLKGKNPNPILKTVVDIATNPLVIIGLALGIMKFPIGDLKPLLSLRRGLIPKAAAMSKSASYMHDAMNNLRTVPGLWESINKQVVKSTDFIAGNWEKLNKIFIQSGNVSKAEGYAIAARLDGLHTTENSIYRLLHKEPEYAAFFGSKEIPIAADMQRTMNPKLISIADRMRDWFTGTRAPIMGNKEVRDRVAAAVEAKGLKFGETVEHYFPHHGRYDKYYNLKLRGTTGINYRQHLYKEIKERIGREEVARMGEMIADPEHITELENLGVIPRGFRERVLDPVMRRWTGEADGVVRGIWNNIEQSGLDEAGQRVAFINQMMEHYSGKKFNLVARLGTKKKALDTLDAMANSLQQARFGGPDILEREFSAISKVLGEPAKFSYNLHDAAGRYLNSVAPAYAWHGLGIKNEVMGIVSKPTAFEGAPHLESYVMDDILPHVLGIKNWQQFNRSLNYNVQRAKIAGWLENHPLPKRALGEKATKWLSEWYNRSNLFSSAGSLDSAISSNFYLSALGLNLSSSAKNALQTWVTTVNHVGTRGLYYGLKGFGTEEGLLSKLGKYGTYLSKNGFSAEAREAGFKAAFPEFVADAGDAHKIVSALVAGDIEKEGLVNLTAAKGVWGKVQETMMMPFATTEAGNRLLAYYAGRNTHLANNAAKLVGATGSARTALLKEAGEVGHTLNMISNFPGGPLGMPRALINLRPEFRQFMHFPLRFMGFIHGSTRLGANPNVRSWGAIGRMLAGSTALYITARNLGGVDISGGLLTGALPLPQYEKSPFYPFPFVPPIAQIAGTATKALATGDMSGLSDAAALMFPSGIAVKRAYQSISPHFADYEHPTQDGRVPLYNNDGALIGSMTPMELTLRSIGLRPTSLAAEAGAAKWLVSQRDRIRQYRRQYTQALFENDTREAERIDSEFKKVYPELGALQIKKSDLRALKNRREIARLNRISKGISSSYRPLFESVIGQAQLGRLTEDVQAQGLDVLQNYLPQQ